MKLMIVGSDKEYSIEHFYIRYLKEAGVDLQHFSAQGIFYEYYYRNFFNKVLYKAGLSGIYRKINRKLKQAITTSKPEIIWIFKGMELMPETLRWINSRNIPLVNYNPDNPFIFSGKGSGNSNITKSINLYQLHFTYNLSIQERLEKEYHLKTAYLPFGFDYSEDMISECRQQEEVMRVCFLGNPDENRAALIRRMADNGIAIDVYGSNWQTFLQHENIRIFSQIYGKDFWKILYRYRVQLNILRIHNLNSHNMRTFEIPGIGGIQLAPDTVEHRQFFQPDENIFLYKDADECIARAKALLALNKEDAMKIRALAFQRSVNSGYSYRSRTQQALQSIKGLVHE